MNNFVEKRSIVAEALTGSALFQAYRTWEFPPRTYTAPYLNADSRQRAGLLWDEAWKPVIDKQDSRTRKIEQHVRDAAEFAVLVIRHNNGDPLAYVELHKRLTPTVRGTIVRVAGSMDENIEQNAWYKMAPLKLDPYRASTLPAYASKTARSAAADERARLARDRARYGSLEDALHIPRRESGETPQDRLPRVLRMLFDGTIPAHQTLAFAFSKLLARPWHIARESPPPTLASLLDRFIEGYSYRTGGRISRSELAGICQPIRNLMEENHTGETTLLDYTDANPNLQFKIHQWSYTVLRSLRRRMQNGSGL